MRSYIFTDSAKKDFGGLEKSIQIQCIKKLDYFCSSENPFQYARKLINSDLGTRRFRVGDYRIICDVDEEGKIIIIALKEHRREIYQ